MNNNYKLAYINNKKTMISYILFKLKEKQYAIDIQNVVEVINMPEIEVPSTTPVGVIGMFNYKGMMIKVIDLCSLLGFIPNNFSINNQLIILHSEQNFYAIHSEVITNIVQVSSTEIQQIPFSTENSVLSHVYKTNSEAISIVDVNIVDEITSNPNAKISNIDYTTLFVQDDKSKQILKHRKISNLEKLNSYTFSFNIETENQYILFTLDNNNYCIDLKYVKEFVSLKRLNITKLPYTEDYIKGILNIKGDFLLVVDLKRFLNSEKNTLKEGSKLIIIQNEHFNLALLVEEIKFIKNIKNIKPSSLITDDNSKYIQTEYMEDGEMYNILNIEKIINDERLYININ